MIFLLFSLCVWMDGGWSSCRWLSSSSDHLTFLHYHGCVWHLVLTISSACPWCGSSWGRRRWSQQMTERKQHLVHFTRNSKSTSNKLEKGHLFVKHLCEQQLNNIFRLSGGLYTALLHSYTYISGVKKMRQSCGTNIHTKWKIDGGGIHMSGIYFLAPWEWQWVTAALFANFLCGMKERSLPSQRSLTSARTAARHVSRRDSRYVTHGSRDGMSSRQTCRSHMTTFLHLSLPGFPHAGFNIRPSNLRAQLAFIRAAASQLRHQPHPGTYRTRPAEHEQQQQDN